VDVEIVKTYTTEPIMPYVKFIKRGKLNKFLEDSIKEIIIIKLYAIIVCNIWRYCTQLYAINLIIIESHD